MLILDIARMAAALAITLGLLGLIVVGLRRYGPETLRRLQGLQGGRTERRLTLIETLTLDPSRRLVLVRLDNQEQLILLGEGQLVSARPGTSLSAQTPPSPPQEA